MWTIGEVKARGWSTVKQYYWPAFLVTLIAGFLGGLGSSGSGFNAGYNSSTDGNWWYEYINPAALMLIMGILFIVTILIILFQIFVGNPIIVGQNRFFMESRSLNGAAEITKVFWAFTSGHYGNIVKIMFLRDLKTVLWTFLLVIPGIYKAYEYAMIPYILCENPEADSKDVFALTKDMMDGNRFQLFLFHLSFIGWYILGIICCCIGALFVVPYEQAATAELYAELRKKISGFPFRGFGEPQPEVIYEQDLDESRHQSDDNGYY